MASSDKEPKPSPMRDGEGAVPPGKKTTVVQTMKPIRHFQQHVCTFSLYAHDLSRQIEAHLFLSRLNEDLLQCAVYDSDLPSARLIGDLRGLPEEEKKLWHSHAYEIKSGMWVCPRVPEALSKPELKGLSKSYGKFWCTWQVDRGDRLPLGARRSCRDDRYRVSSDELKQSRTEMEEPEWINPRSDYWKQHGKALALDVVEVDMKRGDPSFP
ncbi:unnamed protein product [Spirodela intermedia]|uniref:Uncharacterized protein n=1 Tax=Spirodela intermedia TaxID=51605 RepID=A0A7I8J6K9_SPIIN|nr:unnamed protein product [Spirodela intermedia]CAA6665689.1 unnamed protein product [Spirodela intermedia]